MRHRVFSTAAVAAFALAAALPSAAPAADGAEQLLAKHRAFAGWSAGDGAVRTLREVGRVERDGKTIAELRSVRYGGAYRDTFVDADGIAQDAGFTGSVAWVSNENGFTVRQLGEAVRFLFDQEVLFGERSAALTGTLQRRETVDGVDAAVVRVTSAVGFPMDLWIDPATGAYVRATIDPDGKYETRYDRLAYSERDGKRFLSRWHHTGAKSVRLYDAIEVNAAVTPDDVHPPKQTATWTFSGTPATVELTDDDIFVDVVMNGVKGRFILDTGAGTTALTDAFAKKIRAKTVGSTYVSGIGGGTDASIFRVDRIAVGGSTLSDVLATGGLLGDYWRREGIDGLIGFDLLAGAVVDLNLDAKTLRVMDPAQVAPSGEGGIALHPDLSDFHMRVPMQLNGNHDVIATLDTGNPVDVLFSKDLIFRDHVVLAPDTNELGRVRLGGGIAGSEIEECGRLDSLVLGPIRYHPVPACDSPSFSRNEILVGLEFMRTFNYVFDYPDGLVVMTPRKNP